MTQLGNGLYAAKRHEEALTVGEVELATRRRLGDSEDEILIVQGNLAITYKVLGRSEEAMRMLRDLYSGYCRLVGEDGRESLTSAYNYASCLIGLRRFEEAKSLLRKTVPVARRSLGECDELTLKMKANYAATLYADPAAALDDLREAVATLEETVRTARRVLGGEHPTVSTIVQSLRHARAALRARETPSPRRGSA